MAGKVRRRGRPRVATHEMVFMHLSGNPWLSPDEIAQDLYASRTSVALALDVLRGEGRALARARKGGGGILEYDVAPGAPPPGVDAALEGATMHFKGSIWTPVGHITIEIPAGCTAEWIEKAEAVLRLLAGWAKGIL